MSAPNVIYLDEAMRMAKFLLLGEITRTEADNFGILLNEKGVQGDCIFIPSGCEKKVDNLISIFFTYAQFDIDKGYIYSKEDLIIWLTDDGLYQDVVNYPNLSIDQIEN